LFFALLCPFISIYPSYPSPIAIASHPTASDERCQDEAAGPSTRSTIPTSAKKHHDAHQSKFANEIGPEIMKKSTLFAVRRAKLTVDRISYEMTMRDQLQVKW
jgi:hypothetical protein